LKTEHTNKQTNQINNNNNNNKQKQNKTKQKKVFVDDDRCTIHSSTHTQHTLIHPPPTQDVVLREISSDNLMRNFYFFKL